MDYPSFHEVCDLAKKSAIAQLLVQAIASLSTTLQYSRMPPEEIYNDIVRLTKETQKAVSILNTL